MFSIILIYMLVWFLRFTESPVMTGDVSVFVEFTSDIILSVFDITFIRISSIKKGLYYISFKLPLHMCIIQIIFTI